MNCERRQERQEIERRWYLVVSYFNGLGIEIGRKIRGPKEEETGVNSYSIPSQHGLTMTLHRSK